MYYKWQNAHSWENPDELRRLSEENAALKAELWQKNREIGQLTQDLQAEKSEKDRLSGEGKRIFVEITNLKKDYSTLAEDRDSLKEQLVHFQAEEKRKTSEFDKKIAQLEEARTSLEDEKNRIRKEDEKDKEQEKANRDRMWAEHEVRVQSYLTELCRLPHYNFSSYDNKNLPEGFSGKLKPDFMIELAWAVCHFWCQSFKSW
jgi:chromosome segregation ATPase